MEVIPFLVLAVGVDNMFVLAHAMAKQDHSLPASSRLAAALSSAGPSITLAACCEVAAFALGGLLTGMPAVRNFSLAAAAAVALDFGLQVTVFAALLVLDKAAPAPAGGDGPYTPPHSGGAVEMEMDYAEDDEPPYIVPYGEGEVDERSYWSLQRVLQAYFERIHAPALARPAVQYAVLVLFMSTLLASIAALPYLQVGLDQAVALPRDSYLQPYYRDLMSQLRVGPPLLLVVRELDLDPSVRQVERICGVAGCDTDSLVNRVAAAARQPRHSFIAAPAASWLDDFVTWLNPDLPQCCSFRTYYPPLNSQSDFITALRRGREFAASASRELRLNVYAYSLFHVFFEQYLDVGADAARLLGLPLLAVVGAAWALGGSGRGAGLLGATLASLLAHLGAAMWLAGIQVNAVSLVNLAMALGIAVEFGAHVLHAFMAAPDPEPTEPKPSTDYDPPPESRAQERPNKPLRRYGGPAPAAPTAAAPLSPYARRCARAAAALRSVGASVLSGVTLTKLVGVAVLAFARTQIFEVYYFRLYAALVVAGAAHGLVLLPVLLALAGPQPWR
ncbi:hypothetical protein GPECTOR_7g1098 [Gonium pectorale]|uniref:SSD domain-containing protein n=1 Tax=Gonium pectorale TaxID=33097 RepID=A0A150GTL6_GONPE|nr:hypothetical protein GPECTOR_7g1098 [Gonium pectorale]|eukprot:KXZ53205.1 hypothetical protein GPECTOR_7g1098 [Gonium pectorale]